MQEHLAAVVGTVKRTAAFLEVATVRTSAAVTNQSNPMLSLSVGIEHHRFSSWTFGLVLAEVRAFATTITTLLVLLVGVLLRILRLLHWHSSHAQRLEVLNVGVRLRVVHIR